MAPYTPAAAEFVTVVLWIDVFTELRVSRGSAGSDEALIPRPGKIST